MEMNIDKKELVELCEEMCIRDRSCNPCDGIGDIKDD